MHEPLPSAGRFPGARGGRPGHPPRDSEETRRAVSGRRRPWRTMFARAVRLADSGETPVARTVTRLVVLPFRMLRPDPEIDFLSFSLADAITASLGSLESLVVRSTPGGCAIHQRSAEPDCARHRAGRGCGGDPARCCAPAPRYAWPRSWWKRRALAGCSGPRRRRSPLNDVFQLQDDLSRHIVESLALPLSAREQRLLAHDAPATRPFGRIITCAPTSSRPIRRVG